MANDTQDKAQGMSWGRLIIRFIVAAIVLWATALFAPGYRITGFWTPLLQAIAIVGLDYVIQAITGFDASPFGRGFSGFLVSAVIIYLTQFVIPGVSVSIVGAVIAALIIGIIEAILPVNVL